MSVRKWSVGLVGLVLLVPILPVASANVDAAQRLKFGFSVHSAPEMIAAEVPVAYGAIWVGAWTSSWVGTAKDLDRAKAAGVTPVVYWWYWGDDISPSCVENGCWSSLHGVWKDKATWNRMSGELADLIASKAGGNAIVVLENEFNKGGIATWEPFDGYLADQAGIFRAKGVKTAIGFGFWDSNKWSNFDRAVAAADYSGTMMLRSSVRHSGSYDRSVDDLLAAARTLQTNFRKPSLIYDFGLSSYPEPEYAAKQEAQFRELFASMGDFRAAGVEGIIFRNIYDNPNFDTRNYNGMAERYWGIKRADGSEKPAYDDAILGIHREAVHTLDLSAMTTLSNGDREGRIFAWESGKYAIDIVARGWSSDGSRAAASLYVDGARMRSWAPAGAASEVVTVALSKGHHTIRLGVEQAAATRGVAFDAVTWYTGTGPLTQPPGAALVGLHEAEALPVKSVGGISRMSGASGGVSWNLWTNGHVEGSFEAAAPVRERLVVRASGEVAGSALPQMVVSVNDAVVGTYEVPTGWNDYAADVDFPAGTSRVRVAFTNDYYGGKGFDRNLRVDKITIGTPAPPPTPLTAWRQEAEDFDTKTVGGRYWDTSASGKYGWNLWANGRIETSFEATTGGAHELSIVARGDHANGWPLMRVHVDGKLVKEWTVDTSSARTFTLPLELAAGVHKLEIAYSNDYYGGKGLDRNLRVDVVSVRG